MSADAFFKKLLFRFCGFILVLLTAGAGIYACAMHKAEKILLNTSFYYLVKKDAHIAAGVEFAKLEGGAGYLLEDGGMQYVALSVYFDENEGYSVRQNLKNAGKDTLLIKKEVPCLYFKGSEKKNKSLIVNGLNTLKSYIQLLKNTIERLDKGLTQEKCKSLLDIQRKQYQYAKELYRGYEELSEVFDQSAKELFIILSDVVYLKDLRYLLCWQTEKYLSLCSEFSL